MNIPRVGTLASMLSAAFLWVLVGAIFGHATHADASIEAPSMPDMPASPDERMAWHLLNANQPIAARELAEKIIQQHPNSYVGHLVLGEVQHYAEGNFPRALFHLNRALELYEARYGRVPSAQAPWRWHSLVLRELGAAHYALEHYSKRLELIDRYNAYYRPLMIAERAWPLMKLRRFKDARKSAELALRSGSEYQESLALNALCAVEFEAGNDRMGYQACKRAVEHARQAQKAVSAVDLSNLAEASRSLFRLDEAERISLEATKAEVSWYANPWLDLAELYTREGRFPEALSALRQVAAYRARRPAHARDADRAEVDRATAAFLLVIGRTEHAEEITHNALLMPDRRSHTSRDEEQDRAIVALLNRSAHRSLAQQERERAVDRAWPVRLGTWLWSLRHVWAGWQSGRRAVRLLAQKKRLVGTFRLGTAQSAIMPPWLVGELIGVLGAAVVADAIHEARALDERTGGSAYYDAIAAEVTLKQGEPEQALVLARRALSGLGPAEVLLRSRTLAIAAEAARRAGRMSVADGYYDAVFQADPGVLRRLGFRVPVVLVSDGSATALSAITQLKRSPRFIAVEKGGLAVSAKNVEGKVAICLRDAQGAVIQCDHNTSPPPNRSKAHAEPADTAVDVFHNDAFAPRLELSQIDINSLDGSNMRSSDGLRSLFDQWSTGKW